jgi:hypothetical protein
MARIDSRQYYDDPALANDFCEGYVSLPVGILFPPLVVIVMGIFLALALSSINVDIAAVPQGEMQPPTVNVDGHIAPLFTPEVRRWEKKIVAWSETHNLDPNLVATVMQIESCGDPRAVSHAGAMGLFQVMPYHFSAGENAYEPTTNAQRGLAYLRRALDARGGEVSLGLAGYNAGISGAKRPRSAWPNETIQYVYWGTGIYADAQKDKSHSARLDEWLGRGGASLCAQAASRLGLQQ